MWSRRRSANCNDMEAGLTTSQEMTQAYLDRIEFYDKANSDFVRVRSLLPTRGSRRKPPDDARKAGRKAVHCPPPRTELRVQGFKITRVVGVDCSQKKVDTCERMQPVAPQRRRRGGHRLKSRRSGSIVYRASRW